MCSSDLDLADRLGGHARQLLGALERVLLDQLSVRLEVLRRSLDERHVGEARVDDLAADRVGEGDVGADVVAQPDVGPLGGLRAARVDDDQPRAVVDALEDVVEEDRVRLARVRPPQDDQIGVVVLLVRGGPATRSEDSRQTDDARSVSGSVT